jgi:amidophosphoribosyltransferase
MSDIIKHECGIAFIRLKKPLDYYNKKYGSFLFGIQKLYILMEKQRNRGQEGAGVASVKLDVKPGNKYIDRYRSCSANPIQDVFDTIYSKISSSELTKNHSVSQIKETIPFIGEIYLGHLRYATFGKNNIDLVHPLRRASNWRSKNLLLAANFNLTNVDELFKRLIDKGQHPPYYSDTVTLLEKVGYYLEDEIQNKYKQYKEKGYSKSQITTLIEENIDITDILRKSSEKWDGGYAVAGITGHGVSFIMRDPWGIRPAYYYSDEEIFVAASEASVICTAFGVPYENIKEILPGDALIISKEGNEECTRIRTPESKRSCAFERIYFSRGNDREIYRERKKLGELLAEQILSSIDNDLKHTVFSYIPNTAETAFYGMVEGIRKQSSPDAQLRVEKIVIKDAKLRTFITSDSNRDEMVKHVYDVTYGIVSKEDNLVVIDDSIVRGTTLKKSILRIIDTLNPMRIIIVSSAPQIRYPDCYGIDMTRMSEFIAFNAAVALLRDKGKSSILEEVYQKCKAQEYLPKEEIANHVKEIYRPFSYEEISEKISSMVTEDYIKADVKIIFQSVENLHKALPYHNGDWYFTGNYPTPGGNKVVNTSYINWFEGKDKRSY